MFDDPAFWTLLGQEQAAPTSFWSNYSFLPFAIVIGVAFYFMLIRPERQKKNEMLKMLENLKKDDRIVTIGGICGTVVNVSKDSDEVTLRIDENNNTRMRIQRNAIRQVVIDKPDGDGKKDAAKKDEAG